MKVENNAVLSWTEPGQEIEYTIAGDAFGVDSDAEVRVRLQVEELLEEFQGRRVLVATAKEVEAIEGEISEELKESLLHPAYLIEESVYPTSSERGWPREVARHVRAPIASEREGELRRSIFIDNVGVSVGDLVDLVRGQLEFDQVRLIFKVVGKLFLDLHKAGWIHLGLTPWNVRVFDIHTRDGFPRAFFSPALVEEALAESPAAPPEKVDEERVENGGQTRGFGAPEKTVMELMPLSAQLAKLHLHGEEDTAATEEDPDGEGSGETVKGGHGIAAIFDGIDRLYSSGQIEDEIAVTPGFSAPELLSGMGSRNGEAADIFSLGMFLYFLVAGELPPASVYTRYIPAIPARNFRPNFPPGLQGVISRATRPQPEDRFSSVQAMMEAFDKACEAIEERGGVQQRSPSMRLASDIHIGINKRRRSPVNQDSVFTGQSEDGRFALIVVADGVSTASYGSGDLASTALTEEAAKVWEDVLPAYLMDEEIDDVALIHTIFRQANQRIIDYVNEHYSPFQGSPHEVMGSTALVAVIFDGLVTLGSLGDSRVYLQRDGSLEQMTIDHNLWTLSILEGLAADSALAMPHGDALARCLGTFIIEQGKLTAVDPQPDLFRFRVIGGDTLLFTTDGLVDFGGANLIASEDNILAVLLAEPDPALACLELILLANRGGGGDNIGLSIARFY